MRQYEMCELCFSGKEPEGSLVDVDLTAVIIGNGDKQSVQGFYAGKNCYVVRFYPKVSGIYHYKVEGVIHAEGEVEIEPADNSHHGRVIAQEQHFIYEDGTAYYPFGTTVYALAHQSQEVTEQTFKTLENHPFNKIRMCVFPKDYLYNENEPEYYAFEKDEQGKWDVQHPCMDFFDAFEEKIFRLQRMGIEVDLILFHPYDRWGFSSLSQKDNLTYLDYIIRRFAAIPNIWWSLANEYDLNLDQKSIADWEEIEEYVAEHDPYHHLLSNHNCLKVWDYSRKNISHVCIQTKELERTLEMYRKYKKPYIVDECCYEGNLPQIWGCISGQEMTARFWRMTATGAYCTHGETFLDPENDVIWWAKGGVLKGESPKRIAYLKDIVYSLPGPLVPMPGRFEELYDLEGEEQQHWLDAHQITGKKRVFYESFFRMTSEERMRYAGSEITWQAQYEDQVFLYYYDKRCCGMDELELPENKSYRVELIDTWNMTREILLDGVNGKTAITLPGKEGMAVLVTAIQ